MEFKLKKGQLREIFLYEYKLGHKATEATHNINKTNKCTVQLWLKNFRNGDKSLEDEEGCGALLLRNNNDPVLDPILH